MRNYRHELIRASDCRAIGEKYRLLGALNNTHERRAWRSYAAKFPGAMREAEMCGDSTLLARMRCAESFSRWVGQARGACMLSAVDRSVLLWHDLHLLLKDLQQWRASYGQDKVDMHHFLRWTQASIRSELRERWPAEATQLQANSRGRPCSTSAIAWLATRAELEVATLLSFLVDRPGAAQLR